MHLNTEVAMKRFLPMILSMLLLVFLAACLAPSGSTPGQKRAAIDRMHDETLAQLYRQRPTAQDILGKAAGYAVFSNINVQGLFLGGGAGYGVATSPSGQKTYMQMAQAGLGIGLGVQDIRVVFIFHSPRAYNSFVTSGWEFGGQADASAKARDKGAAATGEVSIDSETTMYTMTEAGLMAKINLTGTKYWKDEGLNN